MQEIDTLIQARWIIPVEPDGRVLKATIANGRMRLMTPELLVYGVLRISP